MENMEALRELKEYGESLGLEGRELQIFISDQQAKQREERQAQRELDKLKIESTREREREKDEHELKLKEIELSEKLKLSEQSVKQEVSSGVKHVTVNTPKSPKLPPFEESTDDIDAYLHRFERYAESQRWDKDLWATHLSALLKGNALSVYARLPVEKASDFMALKDALLKRFDKTEDGFRQRFRDARPQIGETFQQFLVRLSSYYTRWIDMGNVQKTFEGLFDLMVRDQFIRVCNNDLALFLRERKPGNCEVMAELADQYREARNVTVVSLSKTDGKFNSVKSATGKAQFNEPVTRNKDRHAKRCFKCNKTDHLVFQCPMRNRPQVHGGSVNNRHGNMFQVCNTFTKVTDSTVASGADISGTKTSTVMSNSMVPPMPVVEGRIGDKKVSVLRDTGCSGVVIRKSLVSEESISDEFQMCILADGSQICVPTARVNITTPYYKGDVIAWCVEQPVYDVIIGNIKGARDPNDPDPVSSVNVVTRQQMRRQVKSPIQMKVPDIIGKDISPDDVRKAQQSDDTLQGIRVLARDGKLQVKASGVSTKFLIKNGLLYRQFRSPHFKGGKVYSQLVVPKVYRDSVMKLGHKSLMAGHQAVKRTLDRIQTEFYWPGIQSEVKRFCQSCDTCQRTVYKGKQSRAFLGKMPTIDTPFKRVAVDLVGPLSPRSSSGNKYILTLVDYATRYPEAVALRSIEAEQVAEALVSIFCRLGFPEEILTDKGSQFISGVMSEVSRLISLKQLTTTPYHPMCNGLVERFNGTLKQMLRRLCAERPSDWDKYLGPALFAYREVPQESSGFSPFELIYGWPVRGSMTILKKLWTKEIDNPETKTVYQYVVDLRERIESTCELVKENLSKASKKQAKFYNRRCRLRRLKVGDQILLLLPTKANKLLMQWKGPFKVVEKVSDLDYKIDIRGKIKTFHINLLKLYVERPGDLSSVRDVTDGLLNKIAVSVIDLVAENDESSQSVGELFEPPINSLLESTNDVNLSPELNDSQKIMIRQLLLPFDDVLTGKPGCTPLIEHDIKLTSDKPVRQKPYPLPFALIDEVSKEVDEMLELGVVEQSNSPYASPFVIVKKKDGGNRFCIDFRLINRLTVFDAEPMPSVEGVVSNLAGYKVFSKLDLTKGYWQVPLSESSKEVTAFQSPRGLLQFRVMPFGVQNASATFTKLMRLVLHGLQNVVNFIDDILLYTMTLEHNLGVLHKVLLRLRTSRMTAKPSKCFIGYNSLECLGHLIGSDTLQPMSSKIDAVRDAAIPKTKNK